jgi:hypothetical protein
MDSQVEHDFFVILHERFGILRRRAVPVGRVGLEERRELHHCLSQFTVNREASGASVVFTPEICYRRAAAVSELSRGKES